MEILMADVFDQVASQPTQQSPAQTGDVFDQVGQPQPDQQQQQPAEQPGFFSRAYETSPLPGIVDAAKGAISDFVNTPVQGEQNFHAMVDSLKSGNFCDAAG